MREVLSETGEEQFLVATNFLTTMIQHSPWGIIITCVKEPYLLDSSNLYIYESDNSMFLSSIFNLVSLSSTFKASLFSLLHWRGSSAENRRIIRGQTPFWQQMLVCVISYSQLPFFFLLGLSPVYFDMPLQIMGS